MKRLHLSIFAALLSISIGYVHAADVKISNMPPAATLGGTEPLPVVQSGVTVRTTPAAVVTLAGSTLGANPSGSIGLTAVNGTATTFMRSDGFPALAQAIVPTWTGIHTWSLTEPRLELNQTGAATDVGRWDIDLASGVLSFRTRTDADATGVTWLQATRGTTTNVSDITLGNTTSNPTLHYMGSGAVTFGAGTVAVANATAVGQFRGAGATGGSTAAIAAASATPAVGWSATGQALNLKNWDATVSGLTWNLRTLDDANTTVKNAIQATRVTGSAVADVSIGNASDNPTFHVLGTGLATLSGAATIGGNITGQANIIAQGALFQSSRATPAYAWNATGQGTDLKNWLCQVNAGVLACGTATDAATTTLVNNFLSVTRGATTAITDISLGNATNNNTTTFLGTGLTTFGGGITATSAITGANVNVNGASAPGVGIYRPTTLTLGFATNTVMRASIDANGNFITTLGTFSAGTKFTTTGCSVSATTGGATAGTFTLGANTCSVVITLAGATGSTAPNGWTCAAHDRTAPTIQIGGESSSTATTATIAIPVTAGATDVISFSCEGF